MNLKTKFPFRRFDVSRSRRRRSMTRTRRAERRMKAMAQRCKTPINSYKDNDR